MGSIWLIFDKVYREVLGYANSPEEAYNKILKTYEPYKVGREKCKEMLDTTFKQNPNFFYDYAYLVYEVKDKEIKNLYG